MSKETFKEIMKHATAIRDLIAFDDKAEQNDVEELALKLYPKIEEDKHEMSYLLNSRKREAFIKGYQLANAQNTNFVID